MNKPRGPQRNSGFEGDYYIKKRLPSAVLVQKVALVRVPITGCVTRMHTVPYEEDVTKGYASEVFEPTWKYGAPYLANGVYASTQ